MATIDIRRGELLGESTTTFQGRNHVLWMVYDARKNPGVAGDVIKLLSMTERQYVRQVHVEVNRVEGAVCTFDIGDGALATQYFSNVNGNALAQAVSAGATAKLYSVDEDIRLTLDNDASEMLVTVKVELVDYANDPKLYSFDEDATV